MVQPEHKTPDNNTASLKEANGEGSCSLASDKADVSTFIPLDKAEKLKASSGFPMQASEKTDASVGSSLYKEEHEKACSVVSFQVEGARHIKYTFNRRKRKNVSMDSTPLCAPLPDKSSDLPSAPKEVEAHPTAEPQDNSIDSPQGDNQLVQVAQQVRDFLYIITMCKSKTCDSSSNSNQLSTCQYITICHVFAAHFVVRAQLMRVLQEIILKKGLVQ